MPAAAPARTVRRSTSGALGGRISFVMGAPLVGEWWQQELRQSNQHKTEPSKGTGRALLPLPRAQRAAAVWPTALGALAGLRRCSVFAAAANGPARQRHSVRCGLL